MRRTFALVPTGESKAVRDDGGDSPSEQESREEGRRRGGVAYLKALGIRVPRGDGFYILRHGNATLMSSFGAPEAAPTIYTHVISEDGKRVAARLGGAVWGTLPESWTRFGRQLDA